MANPWDFSTPVWLTECHDLPTFVGSECPWNTNCNDYPDFVGSACGGGSTSSITLAELDNPVEGLVTVFATVVEVTCIQYYIDGIAVGGPFYDPWDLLFDTHEYESGTHTIYAKSCDGTVTSNTINAIIVSTAVSRHTGDKPQDKGQQRECIVCGFWFPERDFRIRQKDKQWICKWDYDEVSEDDSHGTVEIHLLKGQMRNCSICDFWFAERDYRIRKVRNKWLCKWCEESQYYDDDEGIPGDNVDYLQLEDEDSYLLEDGGKIILEDDTE
jgi:hypothetical protein